MEISNEKFKYDGNDGLFYVLCKKKIYPILSSKGHLNDKKIKKY